MTLPDQRRNEERAQHTLNDPPAAAGTSTRHILMIAAEGRLAHEQRLARVAGPLLQWGVAGIPATQGTRESLQGYDRVVVFNEEGADAANKSFLGQSEEFVRQSVAKEVAAAGSCNANLIVSDLRPTAAITAALTGVPHVVIKNAALARQFDPALLLSDRGGATRRAAAQFGRALQHVQKRTSAGAFRQVAREHGLRHLNSLDDFLEGDLTLLADVPELWPLGPLPASTRWVGPIVWDGDLDEESEPWQPPEDDRGLVYVTAGNTGGLHLADLAVQAFAAVPDVHVLITTGQDRHHEAEDLPDHIQVRQFVHGPTAVRRADVVVHHGGNGTTYQVLREGKPAVAVPFTNDQRANAAVLARHGLGLALDPRHTSPAALRGAVHRVATDLRVAEALSRTIPLVNRTDGAQAAAEEIVRLLDR